MMDDEGIDTVFGALVLIVTCMAASGMMLSMPGSTSGGVRDDGWPDACLDYALCATIKLPMGGSSVVRDVTVGAYLVELFANHESPPSSVQVEAASGDIAGIVDFYMWKCDGWSLKITMGADEWIEVASRSPETITGSDVHIVERAICHSSDGDCAIRLESAL